MPTFDVQTYLEGYFLPGVNQNAAQISQLMQERGIERTIVLSCRAAHVDPLTGNRILKTMLDQSEGLYGSLIVHTNRVDASLASIKELLNGKKFLSVTLTTTNPHIPLNPMLAEEILNTCRRYHKPIYLHTSSAGCIEIGLQLAKAFSTHKFVFLGMGGYDWRAAIAAAHQSVNIYLETSGPMDRAKIPAAISVLGAHRILFGSAMPQIDPAAALGLLDDSDLAPGDRRRILNDNAARLFAIDAVEAG